MKPLFRLHFMVVVVLALLVPAIGMAAADEAAQPAAEVDAAVTEPEPPVIEADTDCGCGARSPARLLETQRRMIDTTAEPGS